MSGLRGVSVGILTAGQEMLEMVRAGSPLCAVNVLEFLPFVLFVFSVGRQSVEQLAAAGLQLAIVQMSVFAVAESIGMAIQSGIAQHTAEQNVRALRADVQRAILVSALIFSGLTLPLNLLAEPLLVLLQQDAFLAITADRQLLLFAPGILMFFALEVLVKFLMIQQSFWPLLLTGVILNLVFFVVKLIFKLLFRFRCALHWAGSVDIVALSISYMCAPLVLLAVMQLHSELRTLQIWRWERECLRLWRKTIRVSSLSLAQIAAFFLIFNVGNFVAGMMGRHALAAQAVLARFPPLLYSVPYGFSGVSIARICGQISVAARATFEARRPPAPADTRPDTRSVAISYRAALLLHVLLAVVTSVALLAAAQPIASFSSNDSQVVHLVAVNLRYVALINFFIIVDCCNMNALHACGETWLPTVLTLGGGYLIAVPLGIYLSLFTSFHLSGLYVALALNYAIQFVVLTAYMWALDWDRVVERAVDQIKTTSGVFTFSTSSRESSSSSSPLSETTPLYSYSSSPSALEPYSPRISHLIQTDVRQEAADLSSPKRQSNGSDVSRNYYVESTDSSALNERLDVRWFVRHRASLLLCAALLLLSSLILRASKDLYMPSIVRYITIDLTLVRTNQKNIST